MDIHMPRHEIELENNPLLVLGFGMNAYFKIVEYMWYMMFWIFVVNLPIFWIYTSYDTY